MTHETHEEPLGSNSGSPLLEALARLNEIGAGINRISGGDTARLAGVLSLIVESAVKIAPGSSAILYTYDPRRQSFDLLSRVSAGETPWEPPMDITTLPDDAPRAGGAGRSRRA